MGFTKKDLKNGDIVTYRDDRKRTIKGKRLIDSDGDVTNVLSNWNNNLKNIDGYRDLDIVKVERPIKYENVFERKGILDDKEKEYLRAVIRPFRNEIKSICKTKSCSFSDFEYLAIDFKDNDFMNFKIFKKGTMYKGMQANKEYTLKELEL